MLNFTEKIANELNIKFIRLDVVTNNGELVNFYIKRGFKIVYTRNTGDYKFNFFEKYL
jgi:ribosomal protein S18 acetylase RimI-like enzyme